MYVLPTLADCCLNGKGCSAEDVAEDGISVSVCFVYSGAALESLSTGSRETGGGTLGLDESYDHWKGPCLAFAMSHRSYIYI